MSLYAALTCFRSCFVPRSAPLQRSLHHFVHPIGLPRRSFQSSMPIVLRQRRSAPSIQSETNSIINGSASRRRASTRSIQTDAIKAEPIDDPAPLSAAAATPPKRARRSSQKAVQYQDKSSEDDGEVEEKPTPKRGRRKAVKKEEDSDEAEEKPAPKRVRRKAVKKEVDPDAAEAEGSENGTPVKRKRAKKPKEPIVYVIPDVPRRDFRLEGPEERRAERQGGYRGRLGYACLNTILRNQDPPKFCSRNVRIKTIEEKGLDYVKGLARQNVLDIIPLLEWNAANNIHMMRLSSEIFPFASHDVYGYDISFAAEELAQAGEAAKRLDQRLTMHPGQFCQLGTPKESVLEASLRELDVHAKVLDLMGVGNEGVMILHGGGVFGDREETLKRIRHTIENRLSPSVRRRLVLENDELGYSAEELLPLCESLDPPVPLVFDFHHDMLRPSSLSPAQIVERAQAIFARRGVPPKYHLSEPRPGAMTARDRRAHSDRCMELPPDLPADADLMLECKDKEQGVLEMYRIYGLFDVVHDNLRPPANDLTMATAGRRSKLDGQGGATKSSPAKRKAMAALFEGTDPDASVTSGAEEDNTEGEVETAATTPNTSPKKGGKPRETDTSLVDRLVEKAKALAAKRGVPYKGPRSKAEIDAGKRGSMTGVEVKRDMERQAAWIREELRAGRERRPFPDSADAQTEMEAPASQVPPEPDAY